MLSQEQKELCRQYVRRRFCCVSVPQFLSLLNDNIGSKHIEVYFVTSCAGKGHAMPHALLECCLVRNVKKRFNW